MLIGNITDEISKRVVSNYDVSKYAKENKIKYLETSAKNGKNKVHKSDFNPINLKPELDEKKPCC